MKSELDDIIEHGVFRNPVGIEAKYFSTSLEVPRAQLSAGHPPKVVWIRRGNCSTDDVFTLLGDHHAAMLMFEEDEEGSFLALGQPMSSRSMSSTTLYVSEIHSDSIAFEVEADDRE